MQTPMKLIEMIGNTPMVEVQHLNTGCCRLFLKLESQNPGGSIKDRVALAMIEAGEKSGAIIKGTTLFEASAGNTGLGLALVAAQKGYPLTLVIPDKMSPEKIFHLKALGAQVILTRSDVPKGHPEYYQDYAERLAKEAPGGYYINQFANPANPLAHELTTGPEIFAQLNGAVDAVVCGVGSGGTITGLSRFFAQSGKNVALVLADPSGSILVDYIRSGSYGEAGSWLVEGIGEDFIPDICDLSNVKIGYTISDAESFAAARELLQMEGILGGSSTGTLLSAALKYCQEQKTPKNVVTFVCDTGNKYLSKMFSDNWMHDQGFHVREAFEDLRDYVGRPYEAGHVISVSSTDSLQTAWKRMQTYSLSQLPVLDSGKTVGLVTEYDIMKTMLQGSMNQEISSVMVRKLKLLAHTEPLSRVIELIDAGYVAIVMKDDCLYGMITPVDIVNVLRNRQKRKD